MEFFSCGKSYPELYHCSDCTFQTELFIFLKKHTIESHKCLESSLSMEEIRKKYSCKVCNFDSHSSLQFLKHITKNCQQKWYRKTKWFHCLRCQFKTRLKETMNHHVKSVHGASTDVRCHVRRTHLEPLQEKGFKCPHCKFKTFRSNNLKSHLTSQHGPQDAAYRFHCDQCPYRAKQKVHLNKHRVTQHLCPIQWFKCERCPYRSKQKHILEMHEVSRHGAGNSSRFECEQCGFHTYREYAMKEHLVLKHTSNGEYEWYKFRCSLCSYKVKKKGSLEAHLRLKHGNEEGFVS